MTPGEAKERLVQAGLSEISIGGECPVECEARVGGLYLYFRARGNEWWCSIARHQISATLGRACAYTARGTYGIGFDAGYMPLEDAVPLIESAVKAWRAGVANKER